MPWPAWRLPFYLLAAAQQLDSKQNRGPAGPSSYKNELYLVMFHCLISKRSHGHLSQNGVCIGVLTDRWEENVLILCAYLCSLLPQTHDSELRIRSTFAL